MNKEILAALFMLVVLGTGVITVQLPQSSVLYASTSNESENEEQEIESNDNGDTDEESTDDNEDTPSPPPPMQTDEPPAPAGPIENVLPPSPPSVVEEVPQQEEPIECPEGYTLNEAGDECIQDPLTELGELVGPPPQCPPELELTPLQCLERIVDEEEEPLELPLGEENQNQTGPSPPQSPSPDDNQTLPPLPEVDVDVNTTDPGDNDTNPLPPVDNDTNGNDTGGDIIDIDIIIKNINKKVFNNEKNHHHENFPQIDIIGLSTKDNGDSTVCLINIDNENVQCQEFGMPSDRVEDDFWRVIETNHNKDYDDGDTGSDDIDGVIDDIKSQDFSELDDATNHDFGIDLAWIAINPQGDGVVCLSEDSTGKGKSLCEPFKVSDEEVSAQITEGVAIVNS